MTENLVRIGIAIGMLILMSALEQYWPRRHRIRLRTKRWISHLSLIAIGSLAIRLILPVAAIGVAVWAQTHGWGVFNHLDWPLWAEVVLTVAILDILIYWQHVASHKIPMIWKLHKVHHSDRDFDASTALRFHPVEILLSMVLKMLAVVAIGASPISVFIFEVLLNACALFNHANFKLPNSIDAAVRKILVTPDMHRVHHSVIPGETNSNYGFCLSIWDRLFRSYIESPKFGHDQMTIGLNQYQTEDTDGLIWTMKLPFVKMTKRTS